MWNDMNLFHVHVRFHEEGDNSIMHGFKFKCITLLWAITLFCRTDNIRWNIQHIYTEFEEYCVGLAVFCGNFHIQYDYEKYSAKYCQSHITLLWLWIMFWDSKLYISSKFCEGKIHKQLKITTIYKAKLFMFILFFKENLHIFEGGASSVQVGILNTYCLKIIYNILKLHWNDVLL